MRQAQIFSGSSHPTLAERMCDRLGQKPGEVALNKFSNGETSVQIQSSVRNQDVFIVQSGSSRMNDSLMELLIMVSACKGGSAQAITAVMPYFPYSRQSKKKSHRGAITARMVANLLNVAGVDHVITLDLHASQMQGFFRCPVDNLRAEPFIARWIRHNVPDWQEAVVVSKNPGGTKRVTSLADALKLSFGIVTTDSRRLPQRYQDYPMHGSAIFERFGSDVADDEDERSPELVRHYKPHVNGVVNQPHEENGHSHHHHRSRNRAMSNSHARSVQHQSTDMPSSPLAKSSLADPSTATGRTSPSPSRRARTNTAPEASAEHFEAQNEEFIDERARDVIHGRLVHGHIVDEEIPSPAFSAHSQSIRNSQNKSGSDDDDTPPNMSASMLSTASSLKHTDGALGGSVDAGISDEEEEEELKNPELETTVTLVGNVKDRTVFIVDDMIDKSGSWIAAAETCVKRGGATHVYCIATHGLFGDDCLDELESCECIDRIVVTNSFPLPEREDRDDTKLTILDVSPLLAEAIRRNHYGESISQLFMHDSWN